MDSISVVFKMARVAKLLGEDDEWVHRLSVAMGPEDGCLWVLDIGNGEVSAFTAFGIECLQQINADERKAACAQPKT